MKVLGRVVYAMFLVFIGFQLFSCSSQKAYNNAIVAEGDIAYDNGDFTLFKELFTYYKEDAFIEEQFLLEKADTRFGVEETDIKFNFNVFLQAENERDHFTVLLTNLSMENANPYLDIILKQKDGEVVVEKQLIRLSDKNWYIQYFEFDSNTINQIIISHTGPSRVESIILYNSSDHNDSFLTKEDHNLTKLINENDDLTGLGIVKREENPFKGKNTRIFVSLGIYVALAAVVTYFMFFHKQKPVHAGNNRQRPVQTVQKQPKPQQEPKQIEEDTKEEK